MFSNMLGWPLCFRGMYQKLFDSMFGIYNMVTAWKVSKHGVFSGPYFSVFRPEKTPYLDTFHAGGQTDVKNLAMLDH